VRIFVEFERRREALLTLAAVIVAVFVTRLLTPADVSWWLETVALDGRALSPA
jgi:hypothetical protein